MRNMAAVTASILLLAGLAASAQAADEHEPAHRHATPETLGTVDFHTSCKPSVQVEFNRAVALMHSFQFGPAIKGFRHVLDVDPGCSIAYWGIALGSWSNPFAGFKSPTQLAQGLAAVDAGRARPARTARERAYIDAVAQLYVNSAKTSQPRRLVAYESAMARLGADYPDDIEAQIFAALALAAAADPSDKTYAKQRKAGASLEALFVDHPDHPGLAHYIIHAYDEPELAGRAAAAARRYSDIAPSTPHALHMPSHTFTRVGDWQASIDTNLKSGASARAADQPADELHANDYMVYAYLQTAQDAAARQLVVSSARVFQEFDLANAAGAAPASAAYFANAAIPARYCIERRDWACAMALTPVASPFPYADAITLFARGLGAAHANNAEMARESIAELLRSERALRAAGEAYWAAELAIQRLEVEGQLAAAQGDTARALATLTRAAAMEDVTELASITPGPFVPAREMLGELLLGMAQPKQALIQFEATLAREPNRFWSVYGAGRAAKRAGDTKKASAFFRQLLDMAHHADEPRRAALVEAGAAVAGG